MDKDARIALLEGQLNLALKYIGELEGDLLSIVVPARSGHFEESVYAISAIIDRSVTANLKETGEIH